MEEQKISTKVSVGTLAEFFDVTQRRIQQLAKSEVIPKPVKGQYELIASVRGYVRFLRKAVSDQGSGSSNQGLKDSRMALLDAQRRKAELELDEKTGKVIPFDEVQEVVNAGAAVFLGQKRSMGTRLAAKLAGMTDAREIMGVLNEENDRILSEVSSELGVLSRMGNAGKASRAKKKAQPGRVGGRGKKNATGKPDPGTVGLKPNPVHD